jgi:hypothetical protein
MSFEKDYENALTAAALHKVYDAQYSLNIYLAYGDENVRSSYAERLASEEGKKLRQAVHDASDEALKLGISVYSIRHAKESADEVF